jgi:AraC-like DNA-binding protein
MDLVSVALAGARVGEAGARWFGGSDRWGMRFDAFEGIGFHVVLTGSAWLIGSADQAVEVRSGDVVLLPSGAGHGISLVRRPLHELPLMRLEAQAPAPGDWDLECLCGAYRLPRGQVHPFLRDLPELIVVTPDPQRHPELAALITLLQRDVSGEQAGVGATRTALIDLVIVHTLRIWREQNADAIPLQVEDAQVGAALKAIHESPQAPWTVEKLSARAGLSRTAFTRRFAVQVGRSPMAYLTGQRLIRGARLLCDTESPLAAIAVQVGYSSEFAFANAFRREFGVAPGRYRHDHQRILGLAPAR